MKQALQGDLIDATYLWAHRPQLTPSEDPRLAEPPLSSGSFRLRGNGRFHHPPLTPQVRDYPHIRDVNESVKNLARYGKKQEP